MNALTAVPTAPDRTAAGGGPSFARQILLAWALAAVVLTIIQWSSIGTLHFLDTDDAMRYREVRDWLGGQSWWDVSQHRLWGGHFAMHWSRLVDLPLALVMVTLDPLVGPALADRVALTIVPLATLLALMTLVATLTRRLAGIDAARLALLMTPLSVPLLIQLRPLRIDHHGWQIVLALAAVAALLSSPTRRSGALAGAALAALLTISLEGLPISATIAGVAALAWAIDPARRAQTAALAVTLITGLAALHLATRGPAFFSPACDAIAPVWIGAIGIATGGLLVALAVAQRAPLWARLALLGASGIAALAFLRLVAPACTAGPFATLDPLVYRLWYMSVPEGLPIWRQSAGWAGMTIALPLLGLAGGALAWRASEGAARARWALMLGIAVPALLLSLLVMRSGGTANALALPGAAWAVTHLLRRARTVRALLPRVAATAIAYLAAAASLIGGAAANLAARTLDPAGAGSAADGADLTAGCDRRARVADYARLPTATVFAPIDITPDLLARTDHRAIGAGYHRNSASIAYVFRTFLGSPQAARARVVASGAAYVIGCPGENETEIYRKIAPNGFWARLERGERFDWLQPVDLHSPARAWRVVRPLPKAAARP